MLAVLNNQWYQCEQRYPRFQERAVETAARHSSLQKWLLRLEVLCLANVHEANLNRAAACRSAEWIRFLQDQTC